MKYLKKERNQILLYSYIYLAIEIIILKRNQLQSREQITSEIDWFLTYVLSTGIEPGNTGFAAGASHIAYWSIFFIP